MLLSVVVFVLTVFLLFLTVCLAFLCINAMNSAPPYIILLKDEKRAEWDIRNALEAHPHSSIVVVDKSSSEEARNIVRMLQEDYPRILFLKEMDRQS